MRIDCIRLFNYAAYKGVHEIDLRPHPVHGLGKNVTLIGGLNGAGKTSLLEGILLGLYGRRSPFFRGSSESYSDYLGSLTNRVIPESEAFVELELQVKGDSEPVPVRVRRSWKRATVRVLENLEVWAYGFEDKYLAENWDSFVEELIPSGLAGLFFFDGEKISDMASSEHTPETVRRSMRFLLGVDLVETLIDDLSRIIRKNSATISSSLRKEFEELQTEYLSLHQRRNHSRQEAASRQTRIDRCKEVLERLRESYLKSGGTLLENRQGFLQAKERLLEQLAGAKVDLITLASGPLPLLLVCSSLSRLYEKVRVEADARRRKESLPLILDRNEVLARFLKERVADSALRKEIQNLIESQVKDIAAAAETEEVFCLSDAGMAQLQSLTGPYGLELAEQARLLADQFIILQSEIEQVERQLQVDVDTNKVEESLKRIAETAQELVTLRREKDELEAEAKSLEQELRRLSNDMSRLANQLVGMDEAERVMKYAARSQDVMRDFRDRLILRRIQDLSDRVCWSFNMLVRKENFIKSIQIDPESLDVSLFDTDGKLVSKSQLASGEKQMLATALLWGLAQTSGCSIPVIIDTPLGRLDSSHRMNFVKQYLPNASHQVVVLSTDTEIVGPYLTALEEHVSKKYLLLHNDRTKETSICEGYFE